MKREWNNYIDSQKYMDCQLVTACNAYYYLTRKKIKYGSKQYEKFVDLGGARYGSAISPELVWEKLGIFTFKYWNYMPLGRNYNKLDLLPLECNVRSKYDGFHSICIVDYEPNCNAFRIPNFKFSTSNDGWIFKEDLDMLLDDMNRGWKVRQFKKVK